MKKTVIASVSSAILFTGVASPLFAAEETTKDSPVSSIESKKSDEQLAREVLRSQGYNVNNVGQNEGKAGLTVKGAIEVIKRNKARIQSAINGAIDKIPMTASAKKKWKNTIKVDVVLGYLTAYTDWGDRVEDAIYNAILKTGAPSWVAKPIAVTIAFLIPIL